MDGGPDNSFFLYLPSSVISNTNINKISRYTTRLQTPIILDPSLSYEAAVVKIIYCKFLAL